MAAIGGLIDVLFGEFHPAFIDALARRLHLGLRRRKPSADAFGSVAGDVYGRIIITQAAVIFGAMAAQRYGTTAPLAIVVGVKTLFDLVARLSAMFGTAAALPPAAGGEATPPSSP